MDEDISMDALLDLSFLTEDEQNAIAEVLRRDSQLRMSEEGRISKLRKSVSDPSWLKILSGDWFRDVRAKRHRHNHFGADIVRASIRRKKSPKASGWELNQRASLGDLEVISEPTAEEEDMPDATDGLLSETAAPQPPWPEETQTLQETTPSQDEVAENKLVNDETNKQA